MRLLQDPCSKCRRKPAQNDLQCSNMNHLHHHTNSHDLHPGHFHLSHPMMPYLKTLLYPRNAAPPVSRGKPALCGWLNTRRQGGSPAESEEQHRRFDPYFHIFNTWLNFLPTKCLRRPNCSAWLCRQDCQPAFTWSGLLVCTCFPY